MSSGAVVEIPHASRGRAPAERTGGWGRTPFISFAERSEEDLGFRVVNGALIVDDRGVDVECFAPGAWTRVTRAQVESDDGRA
ncbi:hypothetical protein G5V58_07705 [Nocardioides anomalus]|uniref:Uncharacterized protein n=1 Tax=Nocardioides anomalus TaxID=2712223 RepID=A0A6G6WBF9_9ACTN|nr:hypothetical protein [Nocardioides anomalus]QIG42681.1 hypothetical protein G5V58_07705 [Nocardioides anomalus]